MAGIDPSAASQIKAGDHLAYMKHCLSLASQSPPKPTNYRVGAVLLDTAKNEILATGYTLELEGNTHAEQCCFEKLASQHSIPWDKLAQVLPDEVSLYTTVEPCSKRLSGNIPCVERIVAIGNKIKTVYVGVEEPQTFVSDNTGRKRLEAAGITVVHVSGLEKEILEVATAGHVKE